MEEDLYSYQYESPIEALLGEKFGKYAERHIAKITPQFEIQASCGRFILDFLITAGERKYAIECDGKEFHEYYPDLYRDAILLGEGHINGMIRFRGKDLYACPNTCVYFLGKLIPDFVSKQHLCALDMEARSERWSKNERSDPEGKGFYDEIFDVDIKDIQEEYRPCRLDMEITCRNDRIGSNQTEDSLPEWAKAFIYIRQNGIPDKEAFVRKYPERFSPPQRLDEFEDTGEIPF